MRRSGSGAAALLRDMAAAGGANYWYVERDDQMAGIFDEEIEARNQLAALGYRVDKMLPEHGDKISAAELSEVESALGAAKKALEGSEQNALDKAREQVQRASHKLPESLYRAAAPGAGAR